MPALICLCPSSSKPNPQCPLAAHQASARAKLQDGERKRAKTAARKANMEEVFKGTTPVEPAPKPRPILSEGMKFGAQRMHVEEAATSQLQGGDKDARDGWAKDLGDQSFPPYVELDAGGREDMARELERMAAQLRHVEAGQRMWAAHKHNAPMVWTGMVDGWVTRAPGPVVNVLVSLVVASTFKVGP